MNTRTTRPPRGDADDGRGAAEHRGVRGREGFAARFDELFTVAGSPPVKSVIRAANLRIGAGAGRITAQRISDWRRGNRTPATFESIRPVLEVLIEEARARGDRRIDPALLDLRRWHAEWKAAKTEPAPVDLNRPPYRGLSAYRAVDRDLFFGREQARQQLFELISEVEAGGSTRLALLLGDAGVGKSSLLAAGLRATPGPRVPITMTPGDDPVTALRSALTAAPVRRGLLLIDHGEQLFTQCTNESARRRFLTELAAVAAPDADPPTTVVMAVDAAHLTELGHYPLLLDALRDRSMVLEPMTEQQMREAIVGPAATVGLRVEDSLVELLLRDMAALEASNTVRLGTLSYTLAKIWQHRSGRTLTVEAYRETGGVAGAFAKGCERIWALLDPREQELTRHLLVALTISGPTAVVRNRVPTAVLLEEAEDPEALRAVIARLLTERAIRQHHGELELVHDMVLTAWPRMAEWLSEEKECALARQRIEADAREWAGQNKPTALLYSRTRLEDAAEVLRRTESSNRLARQFVAAALAHQRKHLRVRRAVLSVGAAITALVVLLSIVIIAQRITAAHVREDAWVDATIAESQRLEQDNPALSTQLALAAYRLAPHDPNAQARLLATQLLPRELVSPALHSGPVLAVTASTGGSRLASAGADGVVRLWNLSGRNPLTPLGSGLECRCGSVEAVTFRPDGSVLASAGGDGVVRLWDVSDGENSRPLGSFDIGTPVTGMLYLPDGRTVVAAGADGTLSFLDTAAPQAIRPLGTPVATGSGAVRALALAPDAPVLASGSDDGSVRLWAVGDPGHPNRLASLRIPGALQALAYGPGGRLAAGTADGLVQFWDVHDTADPRPVDRVDVRRVPVAALAFGLDGQLLFVADADGTIRVRDTRRTDLVGPTGWEVHDSSDSIRSLVVVSEREMVTAGSDGRLRVWQPPLAQFPVLFGGALSSAAFDRSGSLLVDGVHDGRVRLWDIGDPQRSRPLGEIPAAPPSRQGVQVTLRPDHGLLATDDGIGARLWNLADPTHPTPVEPPGGVALTGPVAFDAHGDRLLSGVDHRALQLWDSSDPADIHPLGDPLPGSDGDLRHAALAPDRSRVAAADGARILVWDTTDLTRPAAPVALDTHGATVRQLLFGPASRYLFSADDTGMIRSYDLADPARPREIGAVRAHHAAIRTLDLDASGHRLASGGDDQTARVWDVTDPAHLTALGAPIAAPIGWTWFVHFDPRDHDRLFGVGDKAFALWYIDPDAVATRLCDVSTPRIDEDTWHEVVGSVPRVQLCP
ncbi:AAA family ATPase [Nocardia sp. CDC159]|uniref:AAA family ATPase n=1 Tax=Nocardia pulmonis TaxID=2951408 RepID=A0A9X2EBK7_9NOCA|nr:MULTISPECIES: AAA family ATPase [Nocardia]MCM6775381.1 AAA family ATPase [Nocardia pulmonis]MCM6787885.1 AAA family ATPase [Nocardia sp. CDC159]